MGQYRVQVASFEEVALRSLGEEAVQVRLVEGCSYSL